MVQRAVTVPETMLAGVPAEERAWLNEAILAATALVLDDLRGRRPDDADGRVFAARARNVARRRSLEHDLVARTLSAQETQAVLGDVSREWLRRLRNRRRILAVPMPRNARRLRYPTWQFTASWALRDVMPDLLDAAEAGGLDPLSLHMLMVGGAGEGGQGLGPLLDSDPAAVLARVRAGADVGA